VTGFRVAGGGPVIPNFGQPSACLKHNGWFCTDWLSNHWGDILQPALLQHIRLTLIAVGIGFAISFLLALIGFRWRLFDAPIGGFTDLLYAIPSIALFQLLVPLTGLTVTTVEIALTSYTLFILYRNIVAGLRAATTDVSVVLPVDCPNMTAAALRELAGACRDAAVPQTGPLPGAYRKTALPALERGELSIARALAGLDVAVVELDDELLLNVNTPGDVPV